MIDRCTSVDRLLYHYTKASTATDHILKNRLLQFGSYAYTNDPKESKAWRFDAGTNEDRDLGKYKMEELSTWLSKELKDRTKLACFSTDTAPLSGAGDCYDVGKACYGRLPVSDDGAGAGCAHCSTMAQV